MTFLGDLEAAAADWAQRSAMQTRRFNPRPPGVPRPGSASDAVLQYLRSHPGLKTEAEIRWRVRRNRSAISWALVWLRQVGLIEAVPDPSRNARYLRYRVTKYDKGVNDGT